MATFKDVLQVALERDLLRLEPLPGRVMQVSRGSKRTNASIKIAVADKTAENYLNFSKPKETGFLVHMDGDALNAIAKEIDAKASTEAKESEEAKGDG